MYAGLVLLATQVLGLRTPVAAAAATLAAAALFSPIRLRVQRTVDRRFNRSRYDAEATVAAFAARLKDADDLDTVRDDLASMVQTALEPATSGSGPASATEWTTSQPSMGNCPCKASSDTVIHRVLTISRVAGLLP